jgi:hypothetical protein
MVAILWTMQYFATKTALHRGSSILIRKQDFCPMAEMIDLAALGSPVILRQSWFANHWGFY